MSAPPHTPQPGSGWTVHAKRVLVAWIVLSAVATPLVWFLLGPALPPGKGSVQAAGQVFDNTVLVAFVTPIISLLVVFFVYVLTQFRADPSAELVDGPPMRNDSTVQTTWVAVTSVAVLFLAGFGTYELLKDGAGGGQGPAPIAKVSGRNLQVQVIAQQWEFTYRYPSYGGLETSQLVLPADTTVELHVTSLDATHSFWALQLGVKADANPGEDNIAYVQTKGARSFDIHCAELCGLWHGYMYDTGHVVPASQFTAWIKQQQQVFASVAKYMPRYSTIYYPDPQRRGG
ncbi:MAG TPA: cytochrome c oxidase subunit II [Gaiellaceae bacterium]|jgi:cytochrome c oxidase subunit 2|nr:cytochrome c oxidase subunit II [Gaiellaceae bacterium]